MKKFITLGFFLVFLSGFAITQTTIINGPTTANTGETKNYMISGFICPIPDDDNYWLIQISGPPVTITKTASNMWEVTFSGCGTVVLQGLRPCGGFLPGTKTITVSGAATNATITNPITNLCSGESYTFNATPAGGTWTKTGVGTLGSNGLYTAPTVTTPENISITYKYNPSTPGYCSSEDVVNFTVYPKPTATATSNSPVCAGEDINLSASTLISGATFSWSGPGGYSSSSQNPIINNATSGDNGNYTLTITKNGCSNTYVVSVTVNPIPTVNATSNSPICEGEDINLTASSLTLGATFSWSGPGGYSSSIKNPTISNATTSDAGTYTVTISKDGCSSDDNVTIVINSTPATPTASSQSFCGSATVTDLTATGSNIKWYSSASGGSPLSGSTALSNGSTYYASQTVGGCESGTVAVTVTITPIPVAGTLSGTQTFCSGTSVTLTNMGGDTGGSWSSSDPAVATVNGSGVVQGISGGPATISYTVTGTGGCPDAVATYNITVTPSITPIVSISGDDVTSICSGSTVNLSATPTNGGSSPTYQWQLNGTNIAGETGSTLSISGLSNGDVITVIMVSSDGCADPTTASDDTDPVGIVNNVVPSVTISGVPTSEVCVGEDITFTANPNHGGTTPTYQWQVNGVDVTGETGATFTTSALDSGDVVTVIMTSDDACANPTTATGNSGANGINIGDSENPVFSNCPNDTVVSSGNSCDVNVLWIPPTITDNCSLSPTLTSTYNPGDNFAVGTTLVTYYAEDGAGNIDSCSFNITVVDDEDPVILSCISDTTLYADSSTCGITVPDFTVDPRLSLTDNCSSIAGGTITIIQNPLAGTDLGVGTHTIEVTVQDGGGNSAVCTFELIVSDTIAPTIAIDYTNSNHCEGAAVTWTENITDNCQIDTIITNYQSGDVFPVGTTTVNYTVRDINGNESTYSFDVVVKESPEVTIALGGTYSVCAGEAAVLAVSNPNGDDAYAWSFGGNEIGNGPSITINPTTYSNNGVYTVIVEDSVGCTADTSINLTIESCGITISGAISPNKDGKNDEFVIDELEGYPNTEVWICNRWGTQVYQSDDYKNDWEGTSESSLNIGSNKLPEGTYYYVIRLGGTEGQPNAGKEYTGYVYIKR